MSRLVLAALSLLALAASCAGNAESNSTSASSSGGPSGLCSADDECESGQRCSGGLCVTLECETREDCVAPLVCADGECVAFNVANGCMATTDCPVPYVCDGFTRRCFDTNTGMFLGGDSNSSSSSSSSSSGSTGSSSSGGASSSGGSSTSSSSASAASSSSSSSAASSTGGGTFDLGGWRIEEDGDNRSAIIPENTRVPRGGLLVIARDATRSEFESHWGVTLGSNVVFLKSGNPNSGIPVVNNDESWRIYNRSNNLEDGPTMVGGTAKSYKRTRLGNPGDEGAWDITSDADATPGVTALAPTDRGVVVSEWSDASGGGDYIYEFIEIYVNP